MSHQSMVIYQPWPREVINEAVTEFNAQMHDGAGIPELQAGLHGLDFLTRRSEIDDTLQARIDGCTIEARMRIELLAEQEATQRTDEENRKRTIAAVRNLNRMANSILDQARRGFSHPDAFFHDPLAEEEDE